MKQTYLAYDGNYYKIGKSVNSKKRIENCKTSNPKIKLLGFGYGISESELHLRFKEKRVDREWFNLENNEVNFIIKELSKPKKQTMNRTKKEPFPITKRINEIVEHYGIKSYAEFSKKLDITHQSASNYLKGKQKPDVDNLSKILVSFPDVDARWLITGSGSMFNKIPESKNINPVTEIFTNKDVFFDRADFKMLVEIYKSRSV